MNTRPETWTTEDSELFHDGEMPEGRRGAMSDALRADPALRRRLAVVARIDSLAAEAMGAEPTAATPAIRATSRVGWRGALAVAAIFAIAAAIVWWSPHATVTPDRLTPIAAVQDAEPASIRVVWSIPIITASKQAPGSAPSSEPALSPGSTTLEHALASGDAEGAAKLLANATPEARSAAYRRMGEMIRSGAACERLLDSMEPSQQLAVCREWALDARLRPVTFARLAKLGSNSELSLQYNSVVAALYEYPELRSWLRSYVGEPVVETVSRRRG